MEDQDIYASARQYANLKHDERLFEEKRKRQGKETLALMQERGTAKVKVDFDGEQDATVAVKKRETNRIDEDKLKKALGATTFNRLTSAILDEAKLEAAIKLGDVDPNVVSSCLDTFETPYLEVRFTKKRKRT